MASVYETMTPEQRTERARKAAHAKWANTADRLEATAAARDAFAAGFSTSEEKSEHYRAMARKSAEARKASNATE